MYIKAITKNLSWQALYEGLSSILGFIFYAILARTLGEYGVGTITYLLAFFGFVLISFDLGTSAYFLRKWSVSIDNVAEDFADLLGQRIYVFLFISLLGIFYVYFFEHDLRREFLLMLVSFFLYSLLTIPQTFLSAKNRFDQFFLVSITDRLISLGLGTVFLLFGANILTILYLFIISKCIALAFSIRFVSFIRFPHFEPYRIIHIIKLSIPLTLVSLLFNIYFRIDAIIVRKLLDLGNLGIYSSAYRIFEALLVVPTLFRVALTPIVAKLFAENKQATLQVILQNTLQIMTVLGSFVTVFFMNYAKEILVFLYGLSFRGGELSLIILSITCVIIFNNLLLSTFLYLDHKEKNILIFNGFTAIMNIFLNLLMIPILGIAGAAISTCICECIQFVLLKRLLRIQLIIKPFIIIMFTAVITYTIIHYLHWRLFTMLISSGTVYLSLFLVTGIIPAKHVIITLIPSLNFTKK